MAARRHLGIARSTAVSSAGIARSAAVTSHATRCDAAASPLRFGIIRLAMAFLLGAALALLALTALPHTASADEAKPEGLTFSSVSIDAKASTDGSLQVIERRILCSPGTIGALVWAFDDLPEKASLEVTGVRMAAVDAEGNVTGEWVKLPEVAFVLDWRGAAGGSTTPGPGTDAYSYDSPKNTLYVFSNWSDTHAIVEIEYAVLAGIQVYDDMAQIDWRYVTETWPYAAENLTLTIALPLPSGVSAVSGSNVYAWGHGPAEGELAVGADGVVTYTTPQLPAGRFAEARVLFPQSWLTNLSPLAQEARLDGNIRDAAIGEESGWSDQGVFWRKWDMGVISLSAGLSALALLLAVIVFRLRGKPYAGGAGAQGDAAGGAGVQGDAASACDGALEAVEPAVAGRLLRWNEWHVHDLTATVISLVRRGVLSAEGERANEAGDAPGKAPAAPAPTVAAASSDGLTLVLNDEAAASLTSAVDIATLELLFNAIGEGSAKLKVSAIRDFARTEPEAFVRLVDDWQNALTAEVSRCGIFDAKSLRAQKILAAEAVLVFVAGVAVTAALGNPVPAAFAVPTSLFVGAMANYVPRRSREGAALLERYEKQMSRMSVRGPVSAYLPQPEELARLTDELDGVLEYSYAKAQTVAAKKRVEASRTESFGAARGA